MKLRRTGVFALALGMSCAGGTLLAARTASADVPLPHEGGVHHQGATHSFAGQHGAKEKDKGLAPMDARLWLIAPGPSAPWTMRVDNISPHPLRIAADARLLRLEVTAPATPDDKGVVPKKTKTITCEVPAAMRAKGFPEERALILEPGQSYVESFDPRLLCFGDKAAALEPGAIVRPRFGWDPPGKWDKRPPKAPFAIANLDLPVDGRSLKELAGPTIVVSHGIQTRAGFDEDGQPSKPDSDGSAGSVPPSKGKPFASGKGGEPDAEAKEKADLRDYNTPRLEVDTEKFEDATGASSISVVVNAKNDGRREMLAALRPRMLSFEVTGPLLHQGPRRPERETACAPPAVRAAVPREMFHSFGPDESVSFSVLVAELCPKTTFLRPGLYLVRPTLHATESGEEIGLKAHTEVSRSLHETVVRVQTGRLPYHMNAPRAVPTARLVGGVAPPPTPGGAPSADDELETAWGGALRPHGRPGGPPTGGSSPPPFAPPMGDPGGDAPPALPPPMEPPDAPPPPPEMPFLPPRGGEE